MRKQITDLYLKRFPGVTLLTQSGLFRPPPPNLKIKGERVKGDTSEKRGLLFRSLLLHAFPKGPLAELTQISTDEQQNNEGALSTIFGIRSCHLNLISDDIKV